MRESEHERAASPLDFFRRKAVANLDRYIQSPREQLLHDHQVDVMQSIRDALARGETAGYISLPTGTGKSVVATELIQALGMRTIVTSPRQLLLEQMHTTAAEFIPDVKVSNFYDREKDLSGSVINTTPHSLEKLAELDAISQGTQLLIVDESHTALGEKRHALLRKFPNAILIGLTATPYFQPLEGLKERGLVGRDERWAGMFTNLWHEMPIEEAMERKALAPLDIDLLQTNVSVGDIHITAGGEYNEADIQRYLNTEGRNLLTIGMLAGPDMLPRGVSLSEEQRQELHDIHEKIKGKRTVVFGLNIKHVDNLAERLRDQGINAHAVHSEIDPKERNEILKAQKKGDVPVILGVDMLRLGWDSPQTEVGIYLAPTQSGIVAVQELGRILRLSPETNKQRATAIQLVDHYSDRRQAPILIPNIFNPEAILRGSRTGREEKNIQSNGAKEQPIIIVNGMDIDAVVASSKIEDFDNPDIRFAPRQKTVSKEQERKNLHDKLKRGNVESINRLLTSLTAAIYKENPDQTPLELYRKIADTLPGKMDKKIKLKTLKATQNADPATAEMAKRNMIFINMRSIFAAVEPFLSEDETLNNELIQEGITVLYENFDKITPEQITANIHNTINRGVATYISRREDMPMTWVETGKHTRIKEAVDHILLKNPKGISERGAEDLAEVLSEQLGVSKDTLADHIRSRDAERLHEVSRPDEPHEETVAKFSRIDLAKALEQLSYRERRILELRFGLGGERVHELDEVGRTFNVGRERVRQVEYHALKKLSHLAEAKKLRDTA